MKPLTTKIFLDGGEPQETRQADATLKNAGFPGVEGQTTNPTLIVKNLESLTGHGERKLTEEEKLAEYRRIAVEMAKVTTGPISLQVISDKNTSSQEMLSQAKDRITWIPNGVVKFPATRAGLEAASEFTKTTGPANITLVFSQAQAAAIYSVTAAATYPVYLSPFVGRLDDKGENGMDVVSNILTMYRSGDGHVQTICASMRTLDHLLYAIALKCPIVTIPMKILLEWQQTGFQRPDEQYVYPLDSLSSIPYIPMTLGNPWQEYDLSHPLTDAGVQKFYGDWMGVVSYAS